MLLDYRLIKKKNQTEIYGQTLQRNIYIYPPIPFQSQIELSSIILSARNKNRFFVSRDRRIEARGSPLEAKPINLENVYRKKWVVWEAYAREIGREIRSI